jgi:hypothetical protein
MRRELGIKELFEVQFSWNDGFEREGRRKALSLNPSGIDRLKD